uniref:Uncharacterized protein n=1 Tax=Arion vulgaris TaxID=1028688 RepID=A0A0B6ZU83_9EUPU
MHVPFSFMGDTDESLKDLQVKQGGNMNHLCQQINQDIPQLCSQKCVYHNLVMKGRTQFTCKCEH